MWFWATFSQPYPLLYKVFFIGYFIPGLRCWGCPCFSFRLYNVPGPFLYFCLIARPLLWVLLWCLVVGCVAFSLLFAQLVLFGVFISLLGVFSISALLETWFFLVLGRLSSLGYLKSSLSGPSLSLFFLCRALGTLIFFLSCALDTCFSHLSGLGLLLSLGLPPFQYWSLCIVRALDISSLFIFLGVIKSGYLFLYISSTCSFFLLSSISLVVGTMIFYASTSVSYLLFSSGAMNLMAYSLMGLNIFLFFYFVYLLSFFSIVLISYSLVSPIIAFASLAGLPPLGTFWSKVFAVESISLNGSFFVLLLSVTMFYPYFSIGIHDTRSVTSNPMLVSLLLAIPIILFLVITVLIAW